MKLIKSLKFSDLRPQQEVPALAPRGSPPKSPAANRARRQVHLSAAASGQKQVLTVGPVEEAVRGREGRHSAVRTERLCGQCGGECQVAGQPDHCGADTGENK